MVRENPFDKGSMSYFPLLYDCLLQFTCPCWVYESVVMVRFSVVCEKDVYGFAYFFATCVLYPVVEFSIGVDEG